jgi:tryptophan 7-halogenase
MIKNVLVFGAGSAGLMAALAVKRKIPQLDVHVVRSPDIGVIGVGESTTPQFSAFLFEYLGIPRKRFYAIAKPTWKQGIHFIWGPRQAFEYPFERQLDAQYSDLSRPNGYYCEDEFDSVNMNAALMSQGKAFETQADGLPHVAGFTSLHLFNPYLVKALEAIAIERGIRFTDAKITGVNVGDEGVTSLVLEDGRQMSADLYIDASGFKSELLGKALETPFVSYGDSLYCDRAIVGSWDRTDEFLLPYTVAETMEAGWCWQIDHEHSVNRGYVYSSRFISDDEARAEFLRKNPKAKTWDHVVKFVSGRRAHSWVKNVVGIGNACGFVEPLEATALMVTASQIQTMVEMLIHAQLRPGPEMISLFNQVFNESWDHIRDFLAIHYRFNTRLQNPFWTTCCNEVDISMIRPLIDFYKENGPTGLCRHLLNSTFGGKTQFGIEGFLTMLVGMKVPYTNRAPIDPRELAVFRQRCSANREVAKKGLSVAEALKWVKHPDWEWHGDRQSA